METGQVGKVSGREGRVLVTREANRPVLPDIPGKPLHITLVLFATYSAAPVAQTDRATDF